MIDDGWALLAELKHDLLSGNLEEHDSDAGNRCVELQVHGFPDWEAFDRVDGCRWC